MVPPRVISLLRIIAACIASCLTALPAAAADADDFLIVHCALPGQVRQLGERVTYIAPRKPMLITAQECRQRGGEYARAGQLPPMEILQMWAKAAHAGDADAQTILGELLELGAGGQPDFTQAARWYARAAATGNHRAQTNLGYLYESGQGVPNDPAQAALLYKTSAELPDAPSFLRPELTIIEPEVTQVRGLVKVFAPSAASSPRLIGRVDAPAGLLSLTINGAESVPNTAGVFVHPLSQAQGDQLIAISAVDQRGEKTTLRIQMREAGASATAAPAGQELSQIKLGRFHALLIGNSNYERLPHLKTPEADVRRLAAVLSMRYGFEVTVLENSNRYEMLSALNALRARLSTDDNLLLYYAGHGEMDRANMRGHWLPVDAEPDSTANWISNVAITDIINAMNARQVMLIVDSCYSGTLTRSSIARLDAAQTEEERQTWLKLLAEKRARVVLTSGGLAPVMDAGGGAHSVFAGRLLEVLETNAELLTGRNLYQAVAARVAHAAATYDFEQLPAYAPIARAGHEAGDFLLQPVTR